MAAGVALVPSLLDERPDDGFVGGDVAFQGQVPPFDDIRRTTSEFRRLQGPNAQFPPSYALREHPPRLTPRDNRSAAKSADAPPLASPSGPGPRRERGSGE